MSMNEDQTEVERQTPDRQFTNAIYEAVKRAGLIGERCQPREITIHISTTDPARVIIEGGVLWI